MQILKFLGEVSGGDPQPPAHPPAPAEPEAAVPARAGQDGGNGRGRCQGAGTHRWRGRGDILLFFAIKYCSTVYTTSLCSKDEDEGDEKAAAGSLAEPEDSRWSN